MFPCDRLATENIATVFSLLFKRMDLCHSCFDTSSESAEEEIPVQEHKNLQK